MTTITSLTDRRAARRGERDTAALVAAAAAGEPQAWRELIDRYAVLIRSVCRSHRLSDADADDVAQLTWLRAVEHIGRLRDPDRFGAWVGTTARRECLRVLHGRKRVVPTADEVRNPLFAAHVDEDEIARRRRAPRRGARRRSTALPPKPAHAAAAAALRARAQLRGDRRRSSACRSAASGRRAAARWSACAKKSTRAAPGRLGLRT